MDIFNIYTIPTSNPAIFIEEREILVKIIFGWSDLFEDDSDFVDELPTLLADFHSKFSKFTIDYQDMPGIAFCFSSRSESIGRTIKSVNELFQAASHTIWEIVKMLRWIGLHIGRLRLSPMYGTDKVADRREAEAVETERLWNPEARTAHPRIRIWPSSHALSLTWQTLHFSLTTCICIQCISSREPVRG